MGVRTFKKPIATNTFGLAWIFRVISGFQYLIGSVVLVFRHRLRSSDPPSNCLQVVYKNGCKCFSSSFSSFFTFEFHLFNRGNKKCANPLIHLHSSSISLCFINSVHAFSFSILLWLWLCSLAAVRLIISILYFTILWILIPFISKSTIHRFLSSFPHSFLLNSRLVSPISISISISFDSICLLFV